MHKVARYHAALVILHWALALLIIGALLIGFFLLAPMGNEDPKKIEILEFHMAGGMLILALMIVRLVVRFKTAKPPRATTGYRLLDALVPIVHYGFYVTIVFLAGTGLATAVLANLNRIVFQRSGDPLPIDLTIYPTFVAHALLGIALVGLLVLHTAATLYHLLILQDRPFRRMLIGRRTLNPDATPAEL